MGPTRPNSSSSLSLSLYINNTILYKWFLNLVNWLVIDRYREKEREIMKSSGSNSSSNGGERCSSKMERKTIEKQRRMQMKSLCLKLSSLIPKQPQHISHSSKDALTQLDNLEEAASYIINLRNKIEKLKERREHERRMQGRTDDITSTGTGYSSNKNDSKLLILPIIEVRYQNGNLEVVLILNSSSCEKLTFHKVIRIIEEEGVDIVNASHSTISDKVVYTIHSKVRNPRNGLEASRVSSRLKDWI